MSREIPLRQFAKTVGATLDETVRAVKIATFNGVIDDTRVDTGRLKGNWQITTGRMADSEIERSDKTGSNVKAEVSAGVTTDNIDYLVNNLPYAEVWEERDGMISKNVARLERNIKEAVK